MLNRLTAMQLWFVSTVLRQMAGSRPVCVSGAVSLTNDDNARANGKPHMPL